MKEWLRSRFHVSEDGKVSEKVFLSRIYLNISVIVFCMIAMAISAYAYFSANIASNSNMIQAAHFDVEIAVSSELDGTFVLDQNTLRRSNVYVVNMKADTVYTIEVSTVGTANTGFVVVSAGGYQYHTEQLFLDKKSMITFSVKPVEDMEVELHPHWGTSSHYEDFLLGENDDFYLQDDPNGLSVKELTVYIPPVQNTDVQEPSSSTAQPTTEPLQQHIVASGEYLYAIAKMYGITYEELLEYNPQIENPSSIRTGLIIYLPPWASLQPTTSPETEPQETITHPETTVSPDTEVLPETTKPETSTPSGDS